MRRTSDAGMAPSKTKTFRHSEGILILAELSGQPTISSLRQRFSLLVNERHMMFNVLDAAREELLERQPPRFRVDADALPICRRQRAQDPRNVATAQFDEPQLLFEITPF